MLSWLRWFNKREYYCHKTCDIDRTAIIGAQTKIWNDSQIRENARIGEQCILGKGVYIDAFVEVGSRCKIQNYACLFRGVTLGDEVFIGPGVVFYKDIYTRADNDGWELIATKVGHGASIGANATIRCGISIGKDSMIGAGSVVTKDVPSGSLVIGNPGKVVGEAPGKRNGGRDKT